MIQALALAVQCALPAPIDKREIRGDWIELNQLYEWKPERDGFHTVWKAKPMLAQVILWKYDHDADGVLRPRVVAWQLHRDTPVGHAIDGSVFWLAGNSHSGRSGTASRQLLKTRSARIASGFRWISESSSSTNHSHSDVGANEGEL